MKKKTKKNDLIYVVSMLDIVDAVSAVLKDETSEYTAECALRYNLMILGEAANKVSKKLQQQFSMVPWSEMIAFRNVLIHDYLETDTNVVWDTARNDLPALRAPLVEMLDFVEQYQIDTDGDT